MSGFSMEQPVTVTGLGVTRPMPYFGPQMSVTGIWPSRHIGIYDPVSTERPCGGYGGYDAAANEARRLQDAAWNSVPTYNIHEPYKLPDISASLPDLPRTKSTYERLHGSDPIYEQPRGLDSIALERFGITPSMMRAVEELAKKEQMNKILQEIDIAQIQRQRGPLTVYEQTGDSHITHVKDKGYHVTTYPGVGSKAGFSAEEFPSGYGIRTFIGMDKKGNLTFDTKY